jgi:hypothetical protein
LSRTSSSSRRQTKSTPRPATSGTLRPRPRAGTRATVAERVPRTRVRRSRCSG